MQETFNKLSESTRIFALTGALIVSATALNTAWSAAIFPDKENKQAYASEIKSELKGGAIGITLAASPLLLMGFSQRKSEKLAL